MEPRKIKEDLGNFSNSWKHTWYTRPHAIISFLVRSGSRFGRTDVFHLRTGQSSRTDLRNSKQLYKLLILDICFKRDFLEYMLSSSVVQLFNIKVFDSMETTKKKAFFSCSISTFMLCSFPLPCIGRGRIFRTIMLREKPTLVWTVHVHSLMIYDALGYKPL